MHGPQAVSTSDEVVGGWRRERLRLELADDTVLVDAVFCVTEDRDGDRRETRE